MSYLGNRRGQAAILMIFVVSVVLVIATLMVFYNSSSASPQGFTDTITFGYDNLNSVTTLAKEFSNESIISKAPDLKQKFFELAQIRDSALNQNQLTSYGNFFAKVVREKNFTFENVSAENSILYKLSIKQLFIQASSGNSEEIRNFDLCMLFDKDGNYLKELANKELYSVHCGK